MKNYIYHKNKKKLFTYFISEKKLFILKFLKLQFLINILTLKGIYLFFFKVRPYFKIILKKCIFSNRKSRSVFIKFKLNRLFFKKLVNMGFITGILKKS